MLSELHRRQALDYRQSKAPKLEDRTKYKLLCKKLQQEVDREVQLIRQTDRSQDSLGQVKKLVEAAAIITYLYRDVFPYIEALENGTAVINPNDKREADQQ